MPALKSEVSKLIETHIKELLAMNETLGGVFIARLDGTVAVIGVQGSKKKIIFQTGFVSENENRVLDAQIEIQDLLEEEGVEAISEHDFNLALADLK